MKKIKLAVLTKSFTPYGGTSKILFSILDNLNMQEFEVHIFAPNVTKNGKYTTHKVPEIKLFAWTRALSYPLLLKLFFRRRDFDIVFACTYTFENIDIFRSGGGCHKEFLKEKKRYGLFFKRKILHLLPDQWIKCYLEKRTLECSTLKSVITNFRSGKKQYIENYKINPDIIDVVHNGKRDYPEILKNEIDKLKRDLDIGRETFTILFVGTGYEIKGLKYLLDSCRILKAKNNFNNFRLIVIGKERRMSYYKRVAKKNNISDNTIFLGPVESPYAYYNVANVFVMPSYYEGFSNACLEAYNFKIPVVTTQIAGFADILKESNSDFLLDRPNNIDLLAEIIFKILKERISFKFDYRFKTIEQYTQIYTDKITGNPDIQQSDCRHLLNKLR